MNSGELKTSHVSSWWTFRPSIKTLFGIPTATTHKGQTMTQDNEQPPEQTEKLPYDRNHPNFAIAARMMNMTPDEYAAFCDRQPEAPLDLIARIKADERIMYEREDPKTLTRSIETVPTTPAGSFHMTATTTDPVCLKDEDADLIFTAQKIGWQWFVMFESDWCEAILVRGMKSTAMIQRGGQTYYCHLTIIPRDRSMLKPKA